MSRRTNAAGEAAAAAASEAARVLQARQQEAKAPAPEPRAEAPEPEPRRDDSPPRQIKRGNTIREQIMEEIRSSRGEPKAEEKKEDPAPEATPEAKTENTPVEAKPEAAPVEEPAAPPAPAVVRVKVDGEEFDAPEEEVKAAGGIHAYQRDKASEKRLEKANAALAEARRTQAAVQELLNKQQQPQAPAKPSVSDADFIASKLDDIRFGTPEQGAAALLAIQERAAPKVDPNAIVSQAMAQMEHLSAVRQFDKENADLVTNPIILQAIASLRDTKFKQHQQQSPGTPIDWQKFYSTIAHEVRGAFGRQSQPAARPTAAATGGNPSPASDKEARKASITNLPTAAARAELPKEDKPETREESLNRMRKARGIPAQ
jgi:hypothetical protein